MAIVKILSRHSPSYHSLIRYILDEAKSKDAPVYKQNLRSDNIIGLVGEFIENESFRQYSRLDQTYLFHEIVSLAAAESTEVITNEMVDALAQEYMKLRGETGVMVGTAHRDKAHVHLHFCTSSLHYRTGKSFTLKKAELHELKTRFQEYHRSKFPELTKSFPEHGKGERYKTNAQWRVEHREKLQKTVRECYEQATSQKDFLERLRDVQLHHYERNGEATGIEYDGQKFRFTRLLDEDKQLAKLPIERRAEDEALEAIRTLRERQRDRDERGRDGWDRER